MAPSIRLAIALIFLTGALTAQTPAIALSSATLTIDPQNSDGYTVQGTFSGLSFTNAQTVIFSVGQFAGQIPVTDLVKQPGTNIFTYQDPTGLSRSWFSSLTLDLDRQTFTAQATGIVLAGLPNPFAVQFATDSAAACTMARVQSSNSGNGPATWQLTPGDGTSEPCSMPAPPLATPPSVLVNTPTDVQFQVAIQATANLDPTTVQLFRADSNGQPTGPPLCTLQSSAGNGVYSCSANFADSNPGLIPLVVQASAPPDVLLSPGFSLLMVQMETQADVDAVNAVHLAATTAWWANYRAYGDSAQARIQTLSTLRTLGLPGIAQIGLLEDRLSIGILLTSGMPYTLFLNDIPDTGPDTGIVASQPGSLAVIHPAGTSAQPLQCGSPQRAVVQNNKVIVWKSPFFPEPTVATLLANQFNANACPHFEVNAVPATIANAMTFPEYGTVIIDSHGAARGGDYLLLTGDRAVFPAGPAWDMVRGGMIGSGAEPELNPLDFFVLHSAFFAALPAFQNTVTFASTCWSAYNNLMANIFAANGGAYYGFTSSIRGTLKVNGIVKPGFSERIGPQLFQQLLNNYTDTTVAYQSVDHDPYSNGQIRTAPDGIFKVHGPPANPIKGIYAQPSPQTTTFVLQPPGAQLAYLGNPQLSAPGRAQPYFVPILNSLDLLAQLQGAGNCDGIMNLNWNNTATGGHLTPDGGGSGQDTFTTTSDTATYAPLPIPLPGFATDNITVDFLPNPGNTVAAHACTMATTLPDQVLHVEFDGSGQSNYAYPDSGAQFSANLSWSYSWDMHIPFFQNLQYTYAGGTGVGFNALVDPALPGVSVTGTTTEAIPLPGVKCSGAPVVSGQTGAPFAGVGAIPTNQLAPYPIVHMFVETFGGGVEHLCNGDDIFGFGDQVPGYPGFDASPGLFMFDLDLSQFNGQATKVTVPVNGNFQPGPDDTATGSVTYSGTLTFSTPAPTVTPDHREKPSR